MTLQTAAPLKMFRTGPRIDGGTLRRFVTPKPHAERAHAALPAQHPAVVEGRTIFPSTVVDAEASPRLLVDGHNAAKIGARVRKGPWSGMPIYTLTLEERATCPRSCHVWRECYGNAMHLARRHRASPEMEALLGAEIADAATRHPEGFAVRLHVLGDFYSVRYAARWAVWLRWVPQLHVFGFTAHADNTPIANMIERMNGTWPDRCAIRFSRQHLSGQGMEATTIWHKPAGTHHGEAIICPAQTGRTECCATCGLCWSRAMAGTAIAFIGHGRRPGGGGA